MTELKHGDIYGNGQVRISESQQSVQEKEGLTKDFFPDGVL